MAFPGLDRYFHSALFSLSLLFIQCPGGSLSGLMFPRCSLFRSSFAAGNTHIVAKSLLVCVLCGYNDRLKSFLSFSALRLAAVSSQVHFFLTNFNECEDCQGECSHWPILDAEWIFSFSFCLKLIRYLSFRLS